MRERRAAAAARQKPSGNFEKRVICYMTRRERCESTTTGVSKGVSGQGSARRTPSAEAASGASMTTSRRVQARMQGQQKYKSPREGALLLLRLQLAERVGFEPTVRGNRTPDFESGTFDHSATSPWLDFAGGMADPASAPCTLQEKQRRKSRSRFRGQALGR